MPRIVRGITADYFLLACDRSEQAHFWFGLLAGKPAEEGELFTLTGNCFWRPVINMTTLET